MADAIVRTFERDGKQWVYIDELSRALRGRSLQAHIPWDKCRQEIIDGRPSVEVEIEQDRVL